MNRLATTLFSVILLTLLTACGGSESKQSTSNDAQPTATAAADTATAATASQAAAGDAAHGKELYSQNCITCHGPSGKGDGPGSGALNPKPRDFTNVAYMDKLTDGDIRNTIKYGGAIKGMPQMPSNPQYNDADLASLVAYVRTFSHPK